MASLDDIIGGLSSSCGVSENSVHSEHPRFSKYKNESRVSESQRARRLFHLERQTRARDSCLNRIRGILPCALEDEEKSNKRNLMDVSESTDQETVQVKKSYTSPFAETLMYSEWLVDIPDVGSLCKEWMMVPSPAGRRTLVVAMGGQTTSYSKSGGKMSKGFSDLPGGNQKSYSSCTMLDCIYVKKDAGVSSKYYVLDLLSWNDISFLDTGFNCRRFFLQSKLDEIPELSNVGRFSFQFLPSCLCTKEAMSEMMKTDFGFKLDGLLFYYSEVFYTPGQTPLVGWLKPWMLPEILNVDIPESYIQEREGFVTSQQFIKTYNEKHNFKSSINPGVVAASAENNTL